MAENTLYSEDTPTPKPVKTEKLGAPAVEDNMLAKLTSAIQKKVERDIVHLEVPERPGVLLRISPNITQNQLKAWRRNAGEETKNGLDATKFACSVIGHTTVGILMNDEEVFDESGFPLTFSSEDVLKMTDTTRPLPDAVRVFFGVDPHIEAAALAILDAAGYGDTVDTVDPTKESSKN